VVPVPETPGRTGRPRNPEIDTAVQDATLSLLTESGYSALHLEEVARRAGTTKPAIYRRWPDKQHLVLAALARRLGEVEVPDTGCTLCDLGEGILTYVNTFRLMPPDVLGSLLADCAADPDLRTEFMTALFYPPRAAVCGMLDRAAARGDLRPNLDRELLLDLLGSLVHYRALFDHAPISEVEIEHAIETLLQGAATDYPALVAHSRELEAAHHHHE
jgi:AcrR family transcriptional regulator